MQRSKIQASIWLLVLVQTASAVHIGASGNDLRKKLSVEHVTEIAFSADDKKPSITYQPINHAAQVISDSSEDSAESRLFDVTTESADNGDDYAFQLQATLSNDSCEEAFATRLPSWKINKRFKGQLRLIINHAHLWNGKTLFLCVLDEDSGRYQHLGKQSSIKITR